MAGQSKNREKRVSKAVGSILLSYAAHGLATSSISGIGEITLRDGLIVATASVAAREKQAWIFEREDRPKSWKDSAVDLMIYRKGNNDSVHRIGGIELKWWRREDVGNASNRRRDLIKDLLRAAALYPSVSEFSLVALLATKASWDATAETRGKDSAAMKKLKKKDSQTWNLKTHADIPCVRNAVRYMNGRVPVVNSFHTKVVSFSGLSTVMGVDVFARIWAVRKPQNTRILTKDAIRNLLSGSG